MIILVINAGSSSLKYQVFNMEDESVLAKGIVERIGLEGSFLKHKKMLPVTGAAEITEHKDVENHQDALSLVVNALRDDNHGVIKNMSDVIAVGHRVVHGGEEFVRPTIINDIVMETLERCSQLAPLHNPPNILGIKAAQKHFPGALQVAVFDTAFHNQIPERAFMYGLPYELYEKHRIRRYGFHGISHKYVAVRVAEILGQPVEELKIITLHLGNGASMSAVKNGVSIDTTMGFTPLEGLIMGTRSGSLDPAIVPYIMEKESLDTGQITSLLNHKSGMLGLSGVSSDFRDLEEAANKGNKRAAMSLEVFTYNVIRYIGVYYMAIQGLDALVFTAGIGENASTLREKICQHLDFLGLEIDPQKNETARGVETEISKNLSGPKAFVIPTNEELMIARETKALT